MVALWLRAVSTVVLTLALIEGCQLPAAAMQNGVAHPLIKEFRHSEILRYDLRPVDDYLLITGRVTSGHAAEGEKTASIRLRGMITRVIFLAPPSALLHDVQHTYQNALEGKGFEPVFSCADSACGGRAFNHLVAEHELHFTDGHWEQRYLAARRRSASGAMYAMIYSLRNGNVERPEDSRIYTQVDVIEPLPADYRDDSRRVQE